MELRLLSKLARFLVPNHWIEPINDIHPSADRLAAAGEGRANSDEATNSRQNRQHDERHPHRLGRLMRHVRIMVRRSVLLLLRVTLMLHAMRMLAKSLFAPEGHGHQTRHIERRAHRRDRANQPN